MNSYVPGSGRGIPSGHARRWPGTAGMLSEQLSSLLKLGVLCAVVNQAWTNASLPPQLKVAPLMVAAAFTSPPAPSQSLPIS